MDHELEKYPAMVTRAKELLEAGTGLDDVLLELRELSPSIIQSMKVVRDVLQVPMQEAKLIVHRSRAWSDARDKFSELHEQVENLYGDRTKRAEDGTFTVDIDLKTSDPEA